MSRPRLDQHLLDTGALPPAVSPPRYDRSASTVGVVHLGVGGFHRAHQAAYLDDLLSAGVRDWAVCGVGVLAGDSGTAEALRRQDGLYTLVVREPDGATQARVVGSLAEYLFAPDDPDAVVERLATPTVRMVTLTITEGGYNLDGEAGEFAADDAAVAADLRGDEPPRTVFGLVAEALRRRRGRGVEPFSVVSCDNIEHNGEIARRSFTGFAAAGDPDLADWMREHVRFPNSMVDRITPATTDADRAEFAERYGYEDGRPVFCEPFRQWILEDSVPSDARPPLERVGVQLVDDVTPYELIKLRLLNAGHQAVGYLGALAGYEFVHEASTDEEIVAFLRSYHAEAVPTLRTPSGVDVNEYCAELVVRFGNPGIADQLTRICAYGSDRMPKFVVPAIAANLRAGRTVERGALIVAAWRRYVVDAGESLVDAKADELRRLAGDRDPRAFVSNRALFGELADDSKFADACLAADGALDRLGPRGAARAAARE